MTSVVRAHAQRTLVLVTLIIGVLSGVLAFATPAASANERQVELVESWPPAGETLWLPPRAGNLVFSAPVQLASARIVLFGPDLPEEGAEAQRLTQGRATRFLEYALPLSVPGEYRVEFSVRNAVTGERIEGAVDFAVESRAASVGGGNHRHDAGHVYVDSIPNLLLRFCLVLGAALVIAAVLSARTTRSSGRALARMGGLLIGLGSAATAGVLVVGAVTENSDSPFSAVAATPALWLFVPAAFAGAFEAVLARREAWAALLAAVPLVAVAASTDHGDDLFAFALTLVYAAALSCAALLIALLLGLIRSAVRLGEKPFTAEALVPVAATALAALSLALLPLHARGFVFNGDFASDLAWRASAALGTIAVSAALVAACRLRGTQLGAFLVVFGSLTVIAGSAALLYLPPPTAGL